MHTAERFAPPDAYVESLTIRSYEVTRSGYPQPGTMLRYLEYLATRASGTHGYTNTWYAEQGSAWLVREMSLRLGWLPPMDSEIVMATWVSEFRRVQAFREYAVWHPTTGRMIARARARWAYVHRTTGQPTRVPENMAALFATAHPVMRLPVPKKPDVSATPLWTGDECFTAREYEADVHQHINNCVYGDWLYEAFATTLRAAGRPLKEARPRSLALEYLRPVLPGAQVLIQTAVYPSGSRQFHAEQRVLDAATGDLILRGQSGYLVPSHWQG